MSDAEAVRAANQLFSGPVEFLKAAVELDGLPADDVPELAFAGRSNVGKSSLVNAITGRHSLARTSNTPGRTQQLILFDVAAPPRLRLVDMPGYGFAKAPREEVELWTRLVRRYLRGRSQLKRVLVLIDSRHGAKESDEEMMKLLDEAAVSYQLVLTKMDKLSNAAQPKAIQAAELIGRAHTAAHPEILATSTLKNWGIDTLRLTMAGLAMIQ